MKNKTSIKLPLTTTEKANLRKNRLRIADVPDYTSVDLEVILNASPARAREIHALATFQTIPSIGIRFAEDLVFLGYFSLSDLKHKHGADLADEYEKKKGYWVDPCVEDQFRLVVHFANTGDMSKTWWDFTKERKAYRLKNGYPASRPEKAWYETLGSTPTTKINKYDY